MLIRELGALMGPTECVWRVFVSNNISRGYGDYVECPGVYYINFNNGYESFVRTIVKSLPEGSLRLNAPVSKVIWKRRHENQEVF